MTQEIDEFVAPVQLPTRRISLALKDKLKPELNRLVEDNVIAPVDTPTTWISALVVTIKKNGDSRPCIDQKPLNKTLKRKHYPSSTIDDIVQNLARLDKPSSHAITFGTPWNLYDWLKMPLSVTPAPEEF